MAPSGAVRGVLCAIEFLVLAGCIALGSWLSGVGAGMAGGLGVLVLSLFFRMPTGNIPFEVIAIIMCVITTISTMNCAGGLDWMVSVAERVLRKNPKYVTILAPAISFLLAALAGTGHTSFSTLPVVAEVAKVAGVRPARPLSLAVTSASLGVCASPISAAIVAFTGYVEELGVSYVMALAVIIPSGLIATIVASFIISFFGKDLVDDPIYTDRWERGVCTGGPVPTKFKGIASRPEDLPQPREGNEEAKPIEPELEVGDAEAPVEDVVAEVVVEQEKKVWPKGLFGWPTHKVSVTIFFVVLVFVVTYSILISDTVGIADPAKVTPQRLHAILCTMLTAALLMVILCKLDPTKIPQTSTFRGGMTAVMCVVGIAWMGDTFIRYYSEDIERIAGDVVNSQPWLLSVIILFAAHFLFSQAVTTNAFYPIVVSLGVSKYVAVGAFPAVAAGFLLPINPFFLAAVELDTTGTMKIGRYVFNHSLFIPGLIHFVLVLVCTHLFALMILH
eukprot:Protomagalhaensia_wolfi_Nauph_80__937@NODE_153_length_3394_cov_45_195231_g114_i0_p1_GENE_NODE_153_length_3394_cov_45_195231_g114_i0NODE_153_length_3394_cov_45_195231_g114_i0_p1_ORF_typecomplete_len504_score123_42DcuA_DcuB/PF03605_14/8_2e75DcuA_DcuB/PF03605_14/9e41CitMHS/PF03600_16/0_00018CitMHS/PF03600_16/3_2e02MatC_N/PF07158_11/0_00049MatC_N/PF07158_11/1_5e03MatC_N/PF07158_11/2_7e03DcuC/PF03606_15/0_00098DcuC/PF03606_15/20Na_H_antiporter/PF03553_14/0_0057Na_H_antiporter/PF03553_14/1_8e04DUF1824